MTEKDKEKQTEIEKAEITGEDNRGIDEFLHKHDIKVASKNLASNEQILKEIQALEGKKVDKDKVLESVDGDLYEKKLKPNEIASVYHKLNQKHINVTSVADTTKIYSDTDFAREKRAKMKLLIFYFFTLGIALGVVVTFLVLANFVPYGSKLKTVYLIIDIVVSSLYFCFTYAFFSLKFYYQSKYVKMLGYVSTGLKETDTGKFVKWEKDTVIKEGVEFYEMILSVYNEIKQSEFERKILFDAQKVKIDVKESQEITVVTQGNILIEYRLVETCPEH